jgi:uncharacterized protein (TIGR02646 family)
VKRFDRLPAPAFWNFREEAWWKRFTQDNCSLEGADQSSPLHSWREQKKTLAAHFLEQVSNVRGLCAFCDGELGSQSPPTIEHFIPKHRCPAALTLAWWNLFPACYACNTSKGKQWDAALLRPDLDPVEDWIEFEPVSGELRATPGLRKLQYERVITTIELYGLNRLALCRSRQLAVRHIAKGSEVPNYRFIPR